MNRHESYLGMDYFRVAAALLIVAIHTSPLTSFSETGDFICTRIIARVAVPFFFMVSGFFLISGYSCNAEKLVAFIKKTALLYAAAIAIYIPINIYTGYFKMDNLLPNIIKDILFDGTLYHLWYLPASVIGAAIAWYSVKKTSYMKSFIITGVLYIIGLFGDSYYGIAENIPCMKGFYDLIFQVFDYTRNGIFFAPVFFVLGGYIADNKSRLSLKQSIIGFTAGFILMFSEAITLHHFGLQRHDSMYVFLLPVMYCMFSFIIHFKGERRTGLRTVSVIIYIIHPWMIVIVRMFAGMLNMQRILVDNNLIHYTAVCITSVAAGIVIKVLWERLAPKKSEDSVVCRYTGRAWLEIDLNNLEHNVNALQSAMPAGCRLMAVTKAEAYGHGMYEMTTHLEKMGVKAFAVATIDEGIRLRKYGISGEILILGYTPPQRVKELHKYRLTQTLADYRHALMLNEQDCRINAHIKIDTGMHRLGFGIEDQGKIIEVFSMKNLKITGIFTHLSSADSLEEKDVEFTRKQINSFYNLLDRLKAGGVNIPKVHIQSSYGLLNYPELECDYVRTGIALYGVLSSPGDITKLRLDLKPVLSLKARVVLIREVKPGESVGYGRAFTAARDSLIGILPVGYADGVPRSLSCGNSYVLINGQHAPVVGRICMDQLAVDVTDIRGINIDSVATLIGKDGNEEITAQAAAGSADSITNELLSRMGRRLVIIRKK